MTFAQEADTVSAPVEPATPATTTEIVVRETAEPAVAPVPAPEEASSAEKKPAAEEQPIGEQAEAASLISAPAEESQTGSESNLGAKTSHVGPSGALTYEYPITIPPGRNGMQPGLKLSYNSQNTSQDNVFGYGWSISIPFIQRINRKGLDKLYTENFYESSLSGELVSTGTGTYAAKDENGDFLKYSLTSNVWTVTDKKGTVYKFGTNAAERQDNPADTSKVYKWMMQEVRDTNDNYVKYEYFKDAGQIYPSKIIYTGNGITNGIFEIAFTRTSRADVTKLHFPGFEVRTNYLVTKIGSKINGAWARKYDITYTIGNNTLRAVLNTITETGQDEQSVTIAYPLTDYDYKTNASITWATDATWVLPANLEVAGTNRGSMAIDINGDGYQDFISEAYDGSAWVMHTFRNNADGTWTQDPSGWVLPANFGVVSNSTNRASGSGDINGDGLTDLFFQTIVDSVSTLYAHLNDGDGTWTSISGLPADFRLIKGSLYGGGIVSDVNGDGLVDLLYTKSIGSNPSVWENHLFLSNGNETWSENANWNLPAAFTMNANATVGFAVVDITGDNLPDLLHETSTGGKKIFINKGNGTWAEDAAWSFPTNFGLIYSNMTNVSADMNGDGLVDLLYETYLNSVYTKYLNMNRGNGTWTETSAWNFPANSHFISNSFKTHQIADINSDGVLDFIYGEWIDGVPYKYLYIHNGELLDGLSQIDHSQGGSTAINYQTSSLYKNGSTLLNLNLPHVINTLKNVTHSDGLGGANMVITNTYEGGDYYYADEFDRKLAGFNKVTAVDSAGNKTIEFYHQGNSTDTTNGEYADHISKLGRMYRKEVQSSSGAAYLKSVDKWDKYDLGSGRNFVKNVRSTELTYDGDADHKDRAEEYAYENTYGNMTEKIEYGQVTASNDGSFTDTGTDKFTTTISYATNVTPYIVGLPSQETKVNQSASKAKESKYYYDLQPLGSVTDGNLTKQEMWKTGSTYIDIKKTYNTTYGIVTQEKDPRNNATNYSYDSYNLYPTTVTNALSQATAYTYDYSLGKSKTTTNPNTRVFEIVYDGLDRVTAEKQPDLTTPSTRVNKTTYVYTNLSVGTQTQKTDHLDSSTSVDTYTYTDGLNRLIQTRKEAEGSNYSVTDKIYNNVGKVHKESLPYFSSGSAKASPTATAALLITYSYDPMLRVSSIANAVGITSNAYDDWKLTVTDANSKTKDFYKDAYGNLVRVDEHNGGSTYTTNYEYNGNNLLTKITDALGNVRNFTYDGLGRRLTAEDLHAAADGTFGTWNYAYDDAGNLTQTVDPKNQTVNHTYDNINRVLTEDYTGAAGTEVTYTYDAGTDGIGRLTQVVNPSVTKSYIYNALGLLKQETANLNAIDYITSYDYDRQGNQILITNPDNSQFKHIYNSAGLLNEVQRKETVNSQFFGAVNNFDYSPEGKVTVQADFNGTTTTNTYDATKLYRLSNKVTTAPGGTRIQDLTYTYDPVGNITQIVDASATAASKTANYGYDDLYRLTSATITNVASGQTPYTQTYTYDALGNILTKSDAAGTYAYAGTGYANPHAVTAIGSASLTYDNNGNLATHTTGGSGPAWYSTGGTWTTRKQFTIDHTKVSGTANLTNFPVLVSVTDADLKTVSNGGHVGKSDGTDILFTSSDGVTKLSHELEKYDGVTGNLIAWVKVPTLAYATDTVLIIYYGNASASDQQDEVNVWDSNTKAVWHFNESSGDFSDSTANANTGVATSVNRVSGKIGGGASFNGTSSTVNAGTGSSLNVTGNTLTIEAWVSRASTSSYTTLVRRGTSGSNGYTIALGVSSCTTSQFKLTKYGVAEICVNGLPNDTVVHHLAMVWSGTGVTAYVDGVSAGTSTNTQNFISSTSPFYIGLNASPFFSGTVDEMKVSNSARSADWIKTEYNNQNSPGTFMTLGSVSGGGGTVTTNTWDYKNRLVQQTTGSLATTYAYDPEGQRVSYNNGSVTTYYPTQVYNTDGTNIIKHILANGIDVVTVQGTGSNALKFYTATDHLNGTAVMTDSAGAVVETMDYFPFGSTRIDQKTNPVTIDEQRKYIGREYDEETGLNYLNARYYNSVIGKFISQDPVFWEIGQTGDGKAILYNLQAQSSYSYAGNNPIISKDPNGRFWWVGFYDWSGYKGLRGVGMKALEVLGGHDRAIQGIQRNQDAINDASSKYDVNSNIPNAVVYEEQSHLLNLPGVPFESVKDYFLPNSQLGGYDGGVGLMQVNGAVGEKYGYTKTELARDPSKNIDAGTAYINSFNSDDPATIGKSYNGSTAYGQRIEAQVSNANYNTNVVKYGLQQLVKSLKSFVNSLKKQK